MTLDEAKEMYGRSGGDYVRQWMSMHIGGMYADLGIVPGNTNFAWNDSDMEKLRAAVKHASANLAKSARTSKLTEAKKRAIRSGRTQRVKL